MNSKEMFDILSYDFDEISVTPDILDQILDPDEDVSLGLNFSDAHHGGLGGGYSYAKKNLTISNHENFPSDKVSYSSLEYSLPTNFELSLNNQFSNSCSIGPEDPNTSHSFISYNENLDSGHCSNSLGVTGSNLSDNSGYETFNTYCDGNSNSSGFSDMSSSESATGISNEKRRTRKLLTDLTDEEKYMRIREQNNIASREYRNRKKSKSMLVENRLQDATKRNEQLKFLCKKLDTYLDTCTRSKEILQSLGYDLSHLN